MVVSAKVTRELPLRFFLYFFFFFFGNGNIQQKYSVFGTSPPKVSSHKKYLSRVCPAGCWLSHFDLLKQTSHCALQLLLFSPLPQLADQVTSWPQHLSAKRQYRETQGNNLFMIQGFLSRCSRCHVTEDNINGSPIEDLQDFLLRVW